jgi:uncharacterized cupredoxin-like copper-binding protein
MVKPNRSDRDVFAVGSIAFAFLALVLAFGALATAAQAVSRSNDAKRQLSKLAGNVTIGRTAKISLEEYSITAQPTLLQSGKVTFEVKNVGSITHELVVLRAASAASLPKVKTAGERSVGAIDEEAVAESDVIGETGDVEAGATVTKTFVLTPGTYVIFCNIDNKVGGKLFNHFTHGMVTQLTVI